MLLVSNNPNAAESNAFLDLYRLHCTSGLTNNETLLQWLLVASILQGGLLLHPFQVSLLGRKHKEKKWRYFGNLPTLSEIADIYGVIFSYRMKIAILCTIRWELRP